MAVADIIKNEEGGTSVNKVWANIAYAAATYKFITIPDPSSDIWFAYLGIVGSAVIASKLISYKYGGGASAK